MGFLDDLLRGVAGANGSSSSSRRPGSPDDYRERKLLEQEKASRGMDEDVQKQEVERRAQLSTDIQNGLKGTEGVPKPYDPALLLDLADNPIVQTYIDTLAQDAASANWKLVPKDENADVDDDEIAEAERKVRHLPAEGTWRDFLETTSRGILVPGDMPGILNFKGGFTDSENPYETNELGEVVPVDPATMFKVTDENGFVVGYVQVTGDAQEDTTSFAQEEVAWFSWGNRVGHIYGMSPVEKGKDTVEFLEEVAEKEILDLIQGMPPGILSQPQEQEYPVDDADWSNFKDDMKLNQGERHRLGFAKFPVEYTPLTPNYQELQLLDRYKTKVTELGGVFKVNPSYAGFEFENVNRATDETQQEAYKQRGFRVLLRILETGVTQSILPFINEDLKLEFEHETTAEERKQKAETTKAVVTAGKEAANAGLDVSYRDGRLKIEDGDIDEGNVGSSGGGDGGGLFGMSVDEASDPISEDYPNVSKAEWEEYDETLYRAFENQIMPESAPRGVEKRVWTDSPLPDYVREKIREAIRSGAVFDEFESIPGRVQEKVEDVIQDNLIDDGGWSLGEIADDLQDAFGGITEDEAETVARTETASVLNNAREEGYEDREDANLRYMWVGPSDSRTTEACEELKERTNPDYGGRPVDMSTLVRMENEVHDKYFGDLEFRKHTVHINERHTFRRALPSEIEDGQNLSESEVNIERSAVAGDD